MMNFGTTAPQSFFGGTGFGQAPPPLQTSQPTASTVPSSSIFSFQQPASSAPPPSSFSSFSFTQPSFQQQQQQQQLQQQQLQLQQQQLQQQQLQQQQLQQQQFQQFQQFQQQPSLPLPSLKTKYADLPDLYKKELDSIANLVRDQISTAESLHVNEISDMLNEIKRELDSLKKSRGAIDALIQKDSYTIESLKTIVRKEVDRVEIATRIIDAEKKGNRLDLRFNRVYSTLDYFYEKEEEFRLQAEKYSQRLTELEDHIRSLSGYHQTSPQTVIETVRAQNNSFLLLASRVSDLHNMIEKTREEFLVYWQQYFSNKQPPNFTGGSKKTNLNKEETPVTFKEYANQFVEPTGIQFIHPPPAPVPAPAPTASTPFSFTNSTTSSMPSSTFGAPFTSSNFGASSTTMPTSVFGSTTQSAFGTNMFRK